jgi:hypothetical protein
MSDGTTVPGRRTGRLRTLAGRNLDGLALGWLDFMGLGFFFTEGGGEAATYLVL